MIKSLPRRAALVLAGSAIGLTAVILPAQAAANGWRVNTEIGSRGSLDLMVGVDAVSARDAWAAGYSLNIKKLKLTHTAVLRHWTGTSWHEVSLPARLAKRWNSSFLAFTPAASSARDVWVFDGTPMGVSFT